MQIRFRDGVVFVFSFPVDAEHPPALAVAEKLKAVDAARERLGIVFGMAGFVRAPYLSNVVPNFHAVCHGVLKKAFFVKEGLAACCILIRRKHSDAESTLGIFSAGHKSRSRIKEGTETVPVALACRAGNNVVQCGQQMLRCIHVTRARRCSRA